MDLTPPVARYEQAARHLRRQILGGEYPAGTTLPGAPALSRQLGITQSVANRALESLEAAGLVRMEAGRGSVVLERHRYRVTADIRWMRDAEVPGDISEAAADAVAAQVSANPVLSAPTVTVMGTGVRAGVTAEVADAGHAAAHAMAMIRVAFGDGWDLAGASVTARPA